MSGIYYKGVHRVVSNTQHILNLSPHKQEEDGHHLQMLRFGFLPFGPVPTSMSVVDNTAILLIAGKLAISVSSRLVFITSPPIHFGGLSTADNVAFGLVLSMLSCAPRRELGFPEGSVFESYYIISR